MVRFGPGLPGAMNKVFVAGSIVSPLQTAAPPCCQELPGQVSWPGCPGPGIVCQSHTWWPSCALNARTRPTLPKSPPAVPRITLPSYT